MSRADTQCEILMPVTDKSRQIRNHVHVAVRMKPLANTPKAKNSRVWRTLNSKEILSTANNERYKFDRIYGDEMPTHEIFSDQYQSMIHQAIRGYNVTIFAYG